MKKFLFVCMGNYYRSRLAEELMLHYAEKHNLELEVNSGGLSKIPNPKNPGCISTVTVEYLANNGIVAKTINKFPKNVTSEDLMGIEYVICTHEEEQRHIFEERFPDYSNEVIYWQAPDKQDDPKLQSPKIIHDKVLQLLATIYDDHFPK